MTARAFIVIGLGYGDEGKGHIVDYLTRKYGSVLNVRFNGGPQAAHRVVIPGNREHIFAQFGSGSFIENVETLLAERMFVDPIALVREAEIFRQRTGSDLLRRLHVDSGCPVVTPYHRLLGRIRELRRGTNRHGSCGRGIYELWRDLTDTSTTSRAPAPLRFNEIANSVTLRDRIEQIAAVKTVEARSLARGLTLPPELDEELQALEQPGTGRFLADLFVRALEGTHIVENSAGLIDDVWGRDHAIVFEGAQGTLLDYRKGFFPYVTPGNTRQDHALTMLKRSGRFEDSEIGRRRDAGWESPDQLSLWTIPPQEKGHLIESVLRIGVIRAYATRHGPGPLVTESARLTAALPDVANGFDPWQREFRIGWFDAVAFRHALRCNRGVNAIALTNLDRLRSLPEIKICGAYRLPPGGAGDLRDFLEIESRPGKEDLIHNIRLIPEPLAARRRLTELLCRCRPFYLTFKNADSDQGESRSAAEGEGRRGGPAAGTGKREIPRGLRPFIRALQAQSPPNLRFVLFSLGETADDVIEEGEI